MTRLRLCQGRVVRSDIGWIVEATGPAAKTTEKEFDGLANKDEWQRWAEAQADATQVKVEDLYIEYIA